MPKVRLVRMTVVPEFVTDDGDNLTALPSPPPLVLTPVEWAEFRDTGYEQVIASVQAQIDRAEPVAATDQPAASSDGTPT